MSMEFHVIYPGAPGNTGRFKTFATLDEAYAFAAEMDERYGLSRIEATGGFCQFPSFPWQTIFERDRQGTKWFLGGEEASEEEVRSFLTRYADVGGRWEERLKASPAYKELQGQPFAGLLLPLAEGLPSVTPEEKAMAEEIRAMERAIEEV